MEKKGKSILRREEIEVHCPFCGRYLLTIGYGVSGRPCERCKSRLVAILDEAGFRLMEERRYVGA